MPGNASFQPVNHEVTFHLGDRVVKVNAPGQAHYGITARFYMKSYTKFHDNSRLSSNKRRIMNRTKEEEDDP